MLSRTLKMLFLITLVSCLSLLSVHAMQNDTAQPVELRVMTFNIWVGGELVDFNHVIEVIKSSNADVVGLQEPSGNTRRIANALGWYASDVTHIISRYPLIDMPDANRKYVFVQIAPGQVVAVANVHLTSDPYGPYELRDGKTVEEVLELEQGLRLVEIQEVLTALNGLITDGVPLFLTGDFNTPSYRDWTENMTKAAPERLVAFEWPVSKAVEAVGFVDTFRAVHPAPEENPGNTWTYGYPFPRLNENEMIDRIDFVYVANAEEVVASQILGDGAMPNTDIAVSPYPSDHRAVVSTVKVTPVEPPLFVAPQQRVVRVGDLLVVRYHAPLGEDTDRIAIVPSGGTAPDDVIAMLPPYEANFFGSVTFGTGAFAPGAYDALLLTTDSAEVSRAPFWVLARDAVTTITTDKDTYAVGEPITAVWENGLGLRLDWVAIYSVDGTDLYNDYLAYDYTESVVNGSQIFDAEALGEEMLPEGDYVVRYMMDDAYLTVAEHRFTVKAK